MRMRATPLMVAVTLSWGVRRRAARSKGAGGPSRRTRVRLLSSRRRWAAAARRRESGENHTVGGGPSSPRNSKDRGASRFVLAAERAYTTLVLAGASSLHAASGPTRRSASPAARAVRWTATLRGALSSASRAPERTTSLAWCVALQGQALRGGRTIVSVVSLAEDTNVGMLSTKTALAAGSPSNP